MPPTRTRLAQVAPAMCRQLPTSSSLTKPIRTMMAKPVGRAAARQASEICIAGVVTGISSTANSWAEGRINSRKVSAATVATASSANRFGGESIPDKGGHAHVLGAMESDG